MTLRRLARGCWSSYAPVVFLSESAKYLPAYVGGGGLSSFGGMANVALLACSGRFLWLLLLFLLLLVDFGV